MVEAELKLWIARDMDEAKNTFLFVTEPEMEEDGIFRAEGIDHMELSDHYGLNPGDKKQATLIIE